jgi:hypothetical protein
MATTFVPGSGDGFRPWGRSKVQHFPEAASQTFKRGYPVILDAASTEGRVRVASNDPTAAIVGVAAADASGTTGAMVPVWLAKPELQFIGRTIASDPIDFTDIGSARAIEAHASLAIWVVDTTDAGADSVVIEHYINPDTKAYLTAEGDSEGEVVFHFDPKATIFGAGT